MLTRYHMAMTISAALLLAGACGDDIKEKPSDDDDGGSSSTSGSGGGGSSSSSAGGATSTAQASASSAGGGGSGSTGQGGEGGGCVTPSYECPAACDAVYACGLVMDQGMQLCPGLDGTPTQKGNWDITCNDTCAQSPALKSVVDECDCPGTISTLKALNTQFKTYCETGVVQ